VNHPSAVIDVGTNSVLLLIAEKTNTASESLLTLREESRITRLGEGMESGKKISPDAIQRTIDTLLEYNKLCGECSVETISVVGTEIFRQAGNSQKVIEQIKERTELELQVLSGKEEAEYSFQSALPVTSEKEDYFIVVDIGGGSTEIISGKKENPVFIESMKMGAVSLYEKSIHNDPPNETEIELVKSSVRDILKTINPGTVIREKSQLVGIGGTVTTLAAVHLKLKTFDAATIEGLVLSIDEISNLFHSLCKLSCKERLEMCGMGKGREDIIITGTAILIECMMYLKIGSIIISTKGVRHGFLISKFQSSGF
jgi:exopolyphosphatase/guanosine-5'-triphosphate,3'-diphosphate pyrophosphatase